MSSFHGPSLFLSVSFSLSESVVFSKLLSTSNVIIRKRREVQEPVRYICVLAFAFAYRGIGFIKYYLVLSCIVLYSVWCTVGLSRPYMCFLILV